MVLRPAPLCGFVGTASVAAKLSSMGMRIAVLRPVD